MTPEPKPITEQLHPPTYPPLQLPCRITKCTIKKSPNGFILEEHYLSVEGTNLYTVEGVFDKKILGEAGLLQEQLLQAAYNQGVQSVQDSKPKAIKKVRGKSK